MNKWNEIRESIEPSAELLLNIMNQQRHDFMNDLQVLYGYVCLKKYEKLEGYVENIKERAIRQSYVAKLGVPELVLYLQAFPIRCPDIRLEIHLKHEMNLQQLPVDAEKVGFAIMMMMEGIRQQQERGSSDLERSITLTIRKMEQWLDISFVYHGELQDESLQQMLNEWMNTMESRWEVKWNSLPQEVSVDLRIVFPTYEVE